MADNQYNARDFLRDSIAGDVSDDMSQQFDYQAENQNNDDFSLSDDYDFPPPPLLVVPPGMSIPDFVQQEEDRLGLKFYQQYLQIPAEQQASANLNHSLSLLDAALALSDSLDRLALISDYFALAAILSPNYFYYYLLALARYNLGDDENALHFIELALKQIRDRQQLPSQLLPLSQDTHFTENFYALYLGLLVDLRPPSESSSILNFVLDKQIIRSPDLFLFLIWQFSEDKTKINILVKASVPLIAALSDQKRKQQLTSNLKTLLSALE